MIRRDEAEKLEIIHLVEHSNLSVKRTLEELNVPRSTFYRWYHQYQQEGEAGLIDQRPNPRQIWNRIPLQVKQQVVDLALQHPDRSPRQIAWLFTDKRRLFHLGIEYLPHPEGLRFGREPSLHSHQCSRSLQASHQTCQRAVADRLHVLQDPGLGLVLSFNSAG